MSDSPYGDPREEELGVLQWPPFPDIPLVHVNAFMLALNDSTDECEIALGQLRIPVGRSQSDQPGLDVDVVARVVMTRAVLREFARGLARAASVADSPEGATE